MHSSKVPFTAFIALLVALGGCLPSVGTCETRKSSSYYTCEQEVDSTYCEDSGEHFYEDAPSCNSLGYSDSQWTGVTWYSATPGANGYFASGTGNVTPGGNAPGGGGTGTGACAFFDTKLNRTLCEQRSSSSSCSGKFFGAGTTCLGLTCPTDHDPSQCTLPGSSGGGSGKCSSTYQGPTGDIQVQTQCQSIWNYRCNQKNTDAADKNCLVYDSLDATVSCPYCN